MNGRESRAYGIVPGTAYSLSQCPDTTPRHVEEGAGAGARAQGGLNAAEEIIGLQDEQHLARHMVKELADLRQVAGRIIANL